MKTDRYPYYQKEADTDNYTRLVRETNTNAAGRMSYAHFHDSAELIYVVSGKHTAYINGETIALSENDIVFSNPGDIHYYGYADDNELYVMLAGGEYLRMYRELYGTVAFVNHMDNKNKNPLILGIIGKWFSEYDSEAVLMNNGYINLILSELARLYPESRQRSGTAGSKLPDTARKMLSYIDRNLTSSITLASLADYMGYNKSYTSQLFGRITGCDLRDYLNNLRVIAAWQMISSGEGGACSPAKAAQECGFESLNTFYRAFSRKFGKTPGEMLAEHCPDRKHNRKRFNRREEQDI